MKLYSRYYNTISLNKNLFISGVFGLIISIFVAHFSAIYSNNYVLNSALTVISGFISYKIVFSILFHIDNKRKYTKRLTGKINFHMLKQVIIKMIFASLTFDFINNTTRFFVIIELLQLNYSAVEAAIISSILASLLSYLGINIIVKYLHVFGSKNK